MRGFDVGEGVSVRGGAHAGLVGEQAALGTLGDGGDDAEGHAADLGLRVEGALEDEAEGRGHLAGMGDEDSQTADDVDDGHEGNDLLGDGGEALHAAQEDEAGDGGHEQADDPRGDAESGGAGGGDGVGLHHAAHEAQGQDDGDREEAGQEGAKLAVEGGLDVVDRAAVHGAVGVDLAGLLSQDGLGVVGGHAQDGDEPHPEDGARAAHEDGTAGTHDVAGAHLGGNGGGKRLEGAHAALMLLAVEGEIAEHAAHTLAEAAELHTAGADGEEKARADEQHDEHVI